jgi:hypothetical protein
MRLLKSFAAVIIGLTAGLILSIATDLLFAALGLFGHSGVKNASAFTVMLVIGYRFVFNTIGCYLAARLAPGKPMRHALILGLIGFIISIAGAMVMWNEAPPYYNILLIVTALPAAWLGGRWYLARSPVD